MRDLTAFVLAGGKSTRMGVDKAFLELAGRPLIERTVTLACSVAEQVRIVGDPAKFARFGAVVHDVYADRGPLGGIHAALRASATDLNLILGVDLPFVEPRFLEFLVSQSRHSKTVVTVPSTSGHLQTLCAVYRKEFLAVAEKALVEGSNRIDALFHGLPIRIIEESEIVAAGFSPLMFRNLNTREDWEAARRELESPQQHL